MVIFIALLVVIRLVHCADDGSDGAQPGDMQSVDDLIQKHSSQQLIFADSNEGISRLR